MYILYTLESYVQCDVFMRQNSILPAFSITKTTKFNHPKRPKNYGIPKIMEKTKKKDFISSGPK